MGNQLDSTLPLDIPKEWVIKKLGEIGEFSKGARITKADLVPGGIPAIRYGEIYTHHNYVIRKFYSFISEEVARSSKRIFKGDILFAGSGETHEEIGKCVAYIGEDPAYAGGDVVILRASDEDPEFLGYLLNHEIVNRQKARLGQGHSIVHIYGGFLKEVKVPLPPYSEQREIAKVLSTWDKAIELVDKQIEAKRQLKRGLMQQFLMGKVRFPGFDGKWEEIQLGHFLKLRLRKVKKPKDAYLRLGIRSHGKGTFTTIVDDPSEIGMTHLYQVREGDLIVSITFAWEGAIAMVEKDGDFAHVSHRFPTYKFDTKRVVPEFFRYLMHTPRFFYDLGVVSPGGAGRNRVMNKRNFLKIKVKIPSVEEQKKIGDTLLALDKEIKLLECKLEKLEYEKRGLMQKLLTGKVRVIA